MLFAQRALACQDHGPVNRLVRLIQFAPHTVDATRARNKGSVIAQILPCPLRLRLGLRQASFTFIPHQAPVSARIMVHCTGGIF